jgi:hypothetical protein
MQGVFFQQEVAAALILLLPVGMFRTGSPSMNKPGFAFLPSFPGGAAGLLLLFAALTASAPALAQGTDEERRACTPDVMRLCREFIPSVSRITECLIAKRVELNPDCRMVMTPKPEPRSVAARRPAAPKRPVAARKPAGDAPTPPAVASVTAEPGEVIRPPVNILPAAPKAKTAPRKKTAATKPAATAGVVAAAKLQKKKPAPKIQ